MVLKRKSRKLLRYQGTKDRTILRSPTQAPIVSLVDWPSNLLSGFQVTDSEGHPWNSKVRPDGDVGGPFKTRKVYVKSSSHIGFSSKYDFSGLSMEHTNAFALPSPFPGISTTAGAFTGNYPDHSSSDSELAALGTVAISRTAPVNSVFDAATSLGELYKDGLPTIFGLKTLKERKASNVGDEFLNYQFGWLPLWNDVQDLATAIKDRDKILHQLRRDSGRQVRRRYEFPTETEVTRTQQSGGINTSITANGLVGSSGVLTVVKTVKKKRWFSGAFTYHLPDSRESGEFSRMALEADKLYGLVPSVDDYWNLTPWSWAVDWFVNVGPLLTNVANMSKYGLVLPYAYMMETTIVDYEYMLTGVTVKSLPGPITATVRDITKKRIKATPFGFGVIWDDFDNTQLAILAALGISRRR